MNEPDASPGSLDELDRLRELLGKVEMVDLSHRLEAMMPSWPTHAKFCQDLLESYAMGDTSAHHQLTMSEHSGTHLDAPVHFVAGGSGIDETPLERVLGRAATIEAPVGPNGTVSRSMIEAWEEEHGDIRQGDAVFFHFGWDRLWATRPQGNAFLKDWPGLGVDAVQYLIEKEVRLASTDALSLDVFTSTDFPAHNMLLGHGILIGENFANLGRLPPFSFFVGAPLKIKGGTGSPIRAMGLIPPGETADI